MKHGDLLECNVLGGTASNYIRIDIQVPVQYASIPRDIPDILTVDENKLASLTCQTNGIPAADITWFWDNSILSTLVKDVQILDNISQGIKVETDRTFSVTSNLTFNVNRSHNRRVIYCRARNMNSQLKTSRRIQLNVRFLPTTGILFSGGRDFYMIRNSPTIQTLECSVKGGNPYADLHWSCYHGNQTKFNDSSGAISTVTWKAELHNDSICTCSASHDLGWTSVEQVYIHALYPPTPPFIQINMCRNMSVPNGSFINVLRGDQVDIDCSSSGNPPPTYFWSDSLQSSKLYIQNMSEHLAFEYFCTANNNMDASYDKSISSSITSSFHLDVLYPPKLTRRTTPVVVIEGSNLSLSCDSKPGNPNATSFIWTSTEQPYRNTSGQCLTIQNISRTEEGVFTCVAENIMHPTGCPEVHGRDMENVHVDVQYKASIKTFTVLNNTVNHGDNLTLACDVDSDPPASISIVSPTGARLEYIEGNKLHYSKKSSCLEDIGQFTCVSANKHNHLQPEKRNVAVDVRCSPIYPSDFNQITTIESRLGETAVLSFRVFSNPPPIHLTWANLSNSLHNTINTTSSDSKIINTPDNMSSTLIITNLQPWDAGNYFVRVENEIGSKNETFRIIVDTKSTTIATPAMILGAVGSFGALTGVVIIAVVVFVLYRRITIVKGK
ncbi:hemicentin-1-like [Mya arenaria]|uniref:hemicentin-1-like n=1 Tax=Mya arenaria TaxID=6604 RepID=UPI0022E750D2|nr:hemicentin-1-like [Mya arenaria]